MLDEFGRQGPNNNSDTVSDEEPCKGRTLVSVIIFFQSSWIDMHSGGVVMNRSEARAKESSKRIARSDVCGAREGKKPCLVTGWG